MLGLLSPGVKQPGHEADHSYLSSAKVKNTWNYTSIPPYAFTVFKYRICLYGLVLS